MDWKVFTATFITIFVAEIGDKTQIAAMAAAAQAKTILPVLLATVLALCLAGAMGVGLGSILSKYLNPEKVKYLSGPLFILMGIWVLIRK